MLDVVVIGGGPGGATVGAALTRLGYDVLLLERETFPRHRIGESMLPASLEILDATGALDEVRAAGFPVKRGGVYVWGRSREPWMFRFGERGIGTAYQVERARFDAILLDNARRQGVDVRTGHRVTGVQEKDGRICGVTWTDPDGATGRVSAHWVVDASGQAGVLARRRGERVVNDELRNLAVYGYWRGGRTVELSDVCRDAGPEDRNSIFIESNRSGWSWWIPLGERYFSVGTVIGREERPDLGAAALRERYLRWLAETEYVKGFLADSELQEPLRSVRDWSYRSRELAGPGFGLVGDAAAFVDPILSTGVFLALNAGVAFATVVNSVLRGGLDEATCLDWYRTVYDAVYDDYAAMARHWYYGERTQDSWFWQARRALAEDDDASSFRQSFVAISSGNPYSVYRQFTNARSGHVTNISRVASLGGMGSPAALRTLSARLALDELLPDADGVLAEADLSLGLVPTTDWTLSYALVRPDGSGGLISPDDGHRLVSALAAGTG